MFAKEVEEHAVVRGVLRVTQNELAGKELNGDQPFVIGNERVVRAITDMGLKRQYAQPDIRQPGERYEPVDLQRHDGWLAELPAHRGFGQQELEML